MLSPMSTTTSNDGRKAAEPDKAIGAPPRAGAIAPLSIPDYDSPQALKGLLEVEGLAMSKRFGQNFLVNRNARERILAAALSFAGLGPRLESDGLPAPLIWEIGPGIGSMTELALDAGFRVAAFEIDHGFARLLSRLFGDRSGFRLVEGDFLKTWQSELSSGGLPALIFGNLPYNVANAIVADLIEGFASNDGSSSAGSDAQDRPLLLPHMAFTVQKEGGLRMAAKPGTKDYSAFSVLCTSTCTVKLAFDLSAGSFWPVPQVTSSLVLLKPRKLPIGGGEQKKFSTFCRAAFSSRRKTIKNNLKAAGYPDAQIADALEGLGLAPAVRAEALDPPALEGLWKALVAAREEARLKGTEA